MAEDYEAPKEPEVAVSAESLEAEPEGMEKLRDAFGAAFTPEEEPEAFIPEEPDGQKEEAAEAETEASEVSPSDRLELDRAYGKLRYAGLTNEQLKALEPSIAKTMAAHLETQSSNFGKILQENAELKQLKEQATTATGAPTAPDLGKALEPFAEQFGEDTAKAMQAMLEAQSQSLTAEVQGLRQEVASYKEKSEATSKAAEGQAILERNMVRLEAAYPAMAGDHVLRSEVLENARLLAETGKYTQGQDVEIFDTALATAGIQMNGKDPSSQDTRKILSGQPTAPIRVAATPKPANDEDALRKVFNAHFRAHQQGERLDPNKVARQFGIR